MVDIKRHIREELPSQKDSIDRLAREDMLPTNHGFDEFYGNLYHLNAEEEPELPDYPGDKVRPRHEFLYWTADGSVAKWLQSFKDFPPRQKPGSFSLDRVLEAITKGAGDK